MRQPLGQGRLASLVHSMYDPDHPIDHIQAMTKRNAWPAELDAMEPTYLQAKTRESSTRAPWCHSTAWVKEWPMTPVGVNFLAPLLVHTPDVIRTVAVTMDLEPTEIAIERMLTEKTNDEAEASRAAKMNRTVDPRDVASHGRLDQRGEDLASGAAGVNLVGYITVSSRSPEALARDKRTIRASAGKSYLKLEWCDREHHRAFVNTLPFATGIRRGRGLHVPMRDPLSALTDAFTAFLFGKVETTRLPVRTSTGQAQAVYLPTAAPGLGDSGVIIGREVYSGKGYIYDPFQLYGQQLPAPHWLVLGESGNGKSALEKTYVLRQLRFRDRQVVVLDAQGEDGVGEWNLIAAGAGDHPHPARPDGGPGPGHPPQPAGPGDHHHRPARPAPHHHRGRDGPRPGRALRLRAQGRARLRQRDDHRPPARPHRHRRAAAPPRAGVRGGDERRHRRRTRLGPGRRPGPGPPGRR